MAIEVMTWVWNHSRSRNAARLVLLAIADAARSDGTNAFPSNAELCRKANAGIRTVQGAVQDLIALGELDVKWQDGPGGCNRYAVIMAPADSAGSPADSAGVPQILRGSQNATETDETTEDTPAESAPPQNLRPGENCGGPAESAGGQPGADPDTVHQDPPQNLRPAESAPPQNLRAEPSVSLSTSVSTSSSVPTRARRTRGTRIPDDFKITDEMREWGQTRHPAVDGLRETERFLDYWRAQPGAKGEKLDWIATWRNWIRTADDRLASGHRRTGALATGATPAAEDLGGDAHMNRYLARVAARQAREAAGQ